MTSKMFKKTAPLLAILCVGLATWLSNQGANDPLQRLPVMSSPTTQMQFSPVQLSSSNVEEQVNAPGTR